MPRLVAAGAGLGCDKCRTVRRISYSGALHKVRKTQGGRLTEADARHIKTRMSKRRIKPDPRWV